MYVGSISVIHGAYLREAAAAAKLAGGMAGENQIVPSSDIKVSISDAAASRFAAEATSNTQQAARAAEKEGISFELPDWLIQTDFSDDVMAEAKARFAERRPAPDREDGALPSGVHGLPLLPENQQLLQKIRMEMGELRQDLSDPAKHQRFNELMNLTLPLMANGWAKPLTEYDLVREREIGQAMALIERQSAPLADKGATTRAPDAQGRSADHDLLTGWPRRWEQDGLTMPALTFQWKPGQSLWLDLANEAGIGEAEFLQTSREFSQSLRGEALTQKVERFISDRYTVLQAAQEA
jgi:hypothetical protein